MDNYFKYFPHFLFIILVLGVLFYFLIFVRKYPEDKILINHGLSVIDPKSKRKKTMAVVKKSKFYLKLMNIVLQDFLETTPISFDVTNPNCMTKDGKIISILLKSIIVISTDEKIILNGATRLLGLPLSKVQALAINIITGQLVLSSEIYSFDEIEKNQDLLIKSLKNGIEEDFAKLGLELLDFNIENIILRS
ncbi:SPFH domain-containing protein [Fusobacterium sp. PH5-44]|uniref:SPFH domain-containing protein n=1 Tax=unclassified Fusobacterium TaxID=2648384 RepID=UPI003D2159C2